MFVRPRRRPLMLELAVAAVMPTVLASNAFAVTYIFNNPNGGALNVSTNYAPSGIPGAADTFRLNTTPTITGFLTLTVAANQTIGRLEFNHFAPNTISSTLDGSNNPFVLTLSTGALAFSDAITEAPDVPLDTVFINSPIAGGAGLIKTGPGFAFLTANNLYTGGTTITGGGNTIGSGLSVAKDAALGAAGAGVTFTANGTLRTVSSFATNRAFTIGAGGGRIENFGTLTLNGDVGGNGPLTLDRYTGGTVVMSAVNSFTGDLIIRENNTLQLTGRLPSVNSVVVGGTLDLGSRPVNASTPVLRSAAAITSNGGTITLAGGGSSNSSATLGALTLNGGTTTLNAEVTIGGGAGYTFSALTRQNRSTMFVRGRNLGSAALAANLSTIDINNGAQVAITTVGGNSSTGTNDAIIPWIFGNANVTGGTSQVSAPEAGVVRRTAFGFAPLDASRYATTIGGNVQDNVRLSDATFTQNTAATVNSLVIRSTLNSDGPAGVTGNGALTITSGAIVAVSDLQGEELSIDNPINFGAAEGIVHTAPTSDGISQLTMRGIIAGSNGFTKSGVGDLFLENTANTYTGVTTIDAGTIVFSGNVNSGAAGALGNSTTDVVVNAGSTGAEYVGLLAATPNSTFTRGIDITPSNAAASLAFLGSYGGYGTNFSGQINVEGGYLNLLGDSFPEMLTLSGNVIGAGGLQEPDGGFAQNLRISGNNSYTGGTQIRAGRWEVGSNTALGAGIVYFVGNGDANSTQTGAIAASGAARTLANAIVLRATPLFSGTNALAFTGGVDLGSVPREINVASTADVTMSGIVSRGGITKIGSGRLILSGANTYNGQTIVSQGSLRIASNAALGEAAGPTAPGQATFITGSGTLEVVGNVTNNEAIYFGSASLPIASSSATGNLRNVSGSNTINGLIAFGNVGTVGVDAGSTLTLTGDNVDNTSDNTAAFRKVGGGTVIVKNVRLPSLVINAGQVRVASNVAPLGTSRVNSLQIDAGSSLDLVNNALVYDYSTTSPLSAVRTLLAGGRITTSATQAGARVGYAEASSIFASDSFPQSFGGQVVDNTTVLLVQTLAGDATLDKIVNFDDLVPLAQNYNMTGKFWRDGDFTYDGIVNFDDLVPLAQNYNMTATGNLTAKFGASFAADWALAQSLVPEPTTILALAAAAPLARRRRSR